MGTGPWDSPSLECVFIHVNVHFARERPSCTLKRWFMEVLISGLPLSPAPRHRGAPHCECVVHSPLLPCLEPDLVPQTPLLPSCGPFPGRCCLSVIQQTFPRDYAGPGSGLNCESLGSSLWGGEQMLKGQGRCGAVPREPGLQPPRRPEVGEHLRAGDAGGGVGLCRPSTAPFPPSAAPHSVNH